MKNFKMLSRAEMRNVAGGNMCGPNEFMCADGSTCIDRTLQMDGIRDCPDGSDESYGGKTTKCRCVNVSVGSPAVDSGTPCTSPTSPTCESLGFSCSLGSLVTECN